MSTSSPSSSDERDAPRLRVPLYLRIVVLVMVALASSSAYLTRHCLAVANTTIQAELNLDSEDMGYVFSLFALGYMIFQIPGGAVGLRIGTRNALPLFSVLWSAMTVWTSFVFSFFPLLLSRLAFGLAQAGLVPNTAQIIKDWFPSRLHGSVSAMIGVAMSLGGAATFWLTGELMEIMHWRSVFQVYSLVGILWAVAFWFVFRTRPEQHPLVDSVDEVPGLSDRTPDEHVSVERAITADGLESSVPTLPGIDEDESPPAPGLWQLIAHASIFWMCVQAPFRAAGYNLFVTYFPEFLERGHEMSVGEAARMATWPFIGVIAGGLVGGVVIDTLQKLTGNRTISRSGFAAVALVLTTVLTVLSAYAPTPGQVVLLITLGSAFSGMASPAVWAGLIDLGGKHAAVVSGASNMIGCLAGVVFTPLVGILVDRIKENGSGWDVLILVHAGFYACAALAFMFVRIGNRPVTEPTVDKGSDESPDSDSMVWQDDQR